MVKRQMNTGGWVLFAVLLLCCLPLCWLPWLIDSCFDDVRSCESCGTRWG